MVGVSGGADSSALLAGLHALGAAHRFPLDLHVAHVNHGLRGAESDRDEAFVRERARAWSLPFHGHRVPPGILSGANLESRSRDLRFTFFADVAKEVGAAAIAVGHTRDDQAETLLHRLARGAGPRALASMVVRRADGLVRPLLRFRRAECEAYLTERGLGHVDDRSNDDARFTRNRIRHRVLPVLREELGGDIVERLARLADDLRVEAALADEAQRAQLPASPGEPLPIAAVAAAGIGAGRLVHAWLAASGYLARREQIDALVRVALRGGASDGIDLFGGRVVRDYEVLRIEEPEPEPALVDRSPREWVLPGSVDLKTGWRLAAKVGGAGRPSVRPGEHAVAFDQDRILGPVVVRLPEPGDRIRLRAGRRKLSDVLIDQKVPRAERARLAVVSHGADILWVPGIAVAADAVPGDGTRRWIHLRAEPVDCRYFGSVVETQRIRVRFG